MDYRYIVYTDWINKWVYTHNIELEPFPFEDIFWSSYRLRMTASKVTTCEDGEIITWLSPVFIAENFTLNDVLEQEVIMEWPSQGADGADVPEHLISYIFIRYPVNEIEFSVLFGNVLVTIRSEGLSPHLVWDLFVEITENLQTPYYR